MPVSCLYQQSCDPDFLERAKAWFTKWQIICCGTTLEELAGNSSLWSEEKNSSWGRVSSETLCYKLLEEGCQQKLLTAGCCWLPHTARAGPWRKLPAPLEPDVGESRASCRSQSSKRTRTRKQNAFPLQYMSAHSIDKDSVCQWAKKFSLKNLDSFSQSR